MPTLRKKMTEDMQLRNLSPHTQLSYLLQVTQFTHHFGVPSETLGPEEIRAYQLHLVNERKVIAQFRLRRRGGSSICVQRSCELGSFFLNICSGGAIERT